MGEINAELRSRVSLTSRNNSQSGDPDEDPQSTVQNTGWLRSKTSRLRNRKSYVFAAVVILVLGTMVAALPFEDVSLVSFYA